MMPEVRINSHNSIAHKIHAMETRLSRLFDVCHHSGWNRIPVVVPTRELPELMEWLETEAGDKWAYSSQRRGCCTFYVKDSVTALKFRIKHGF
jgi:hypothetical protein